MNKKETEETPEIKSELMKAYEKLMVKIDAVLEKKRQREYAKRS